MTRENPGADAAFTGPWATAARVRGGAVMVQDLGGTILRIDDALRQMIPALDVGGNGFDGVPIEYAEDGAQMMVQNFGQAVRVRFPMRDATGVTAWFSFECNWPTGLVVAALWPEPDPERHRLHTEPLDIEPAV